MRLLALLIYGTCYGIKHKLARKVRSALVRYLRSCNRIVKSHTTNVCRKPIYEFSRLDAYSILACACLVSIAQVGKKSKIFFVMCWNCLLVGLSIAKISWVICKRNRSLQSIEETGATKCRQMFSIRLAAPMCASVDCRELLLGIPILHVAMEFRSCDVCNIFMCFARLTFYFLFLFWFNLVCRTEKERKANNHQSRLCDWLY